MRRRLPYVEGDWFTIPLEEGEYAIGLIARAGPRGKVLLGYFFGPRMKECPTLQQVELYQPEDAVLVAMFGDLGLITGKWQVLGRSSAWSRNDWPMPPFKSIDVLNPTKAYRRVYSDSDPNQLVEETMSSPEMLETYPIDGLWGAEAIRDELSRLL